MSTYDYGMWSLVFFNSALFLLFVFAFLHPRKKREWRSLGVAAAFIVALFTEMYGFPLTVYILTGVLGAKYPALQPFSHARGHLLATLFLGEKWTLVVCQLGNLFMLGGMALVAAGWWRIYRAQGELVTGGIYRYLRHPQYLGLIVFAAGLIVQWPTIAGLLMFPLVVLAYVRLAGREEKELEREFGEAYLSYKERTPAFLPFLRRSTLSSYSSCREV